MERPYYSDGLLYNSLHKECWQTPRWTITPMINCQTNLSSLNLSFRNILLFQDMIIRDDDKSIRDFLIKNFYMISENLGDIIVTDNKRVKIDQYNVYNYLVFYRYEEYQDPVMIAMKIKTLSNIIKRNEYPPEIPKHMEHLFSNIG